MQCELEGKSKPSMENETVSAPGLDVNNISFDDLLWILGTGLNFKTDSGAQSQVTLGKISHNIILKTIFTVSKLVLLLF